MTTATSHAPDSITPPDNSLPSKDTTGFTPPDKYVPTPKELAEYFRERSHNGLIGFSGKMQAVHHIINSVGPTNASVLIIGETGTGKELVARALHSLYSGEKGRPFIGENIGALPPELLESILFGHKKGAFTGAIDDHIGLFQTANHGTIFLDEIGEMSPYLQVKLLRVLQEREVRRLGGTKADKLEVRVISATNSDLATAIPEGRFREDLYFRLNVVQIDLPPLRERGPNDIRMLVDYYNMKFSITYSQHRKYRKITEDGYQFLQSRTWPGNIRELSNFMERAVLFSEDCSPMDVNYFEKVPVGAYEKRKEIVAFQAHSSTPKIVDISSIMRVRKMESTHAPNDTSVNPVGRYALPSDGTEYAYAPGLQLSDVVKEAKDAAERVFITQALEHHKWNRRKTSDSIGMSYKTLLTRINYLGIGK